MHRKDDLQGFWKWQCNQGWRRMERNETVGLCVSIVGPGTNNL